MAVSPTVISSIAIPGMAATIGVIVPHLFRCFIGYPLPSMDLSHGASRITIASVNQGGLVVGPRARESQC